MQQLLDPTLEVVAKAKADVRQSSARLLHLLSFVPDDKLDWSPAATSRSSIRIVAHCGVVNAMFAQVITGTLPEEFLSPKQVFAHAVAEEAKFTTREGVVSYVHETTAQLCAAMDTVTTVNIGSAPNSPFGPMPMPFWLSVAGQHALAHSGQLEYLQTIWGDLDPHFAG